MKKLVNENTGAGLLFIALGGLGAALSLQETIGTASRMGSGFMPLLLSSLLVMLGIVIFVRGPDGTERPARVVTVRGLVMIVLAIAAFAAGVSRLGFAPAIFISAVVASYAEPGRKLLSVIIFAALLSLFCCAVFVWGLGLTIKIVELPWTF